MHIMLGQLGTTDKPMQEHRPFNKIPVLCDLAEGLLKQDVN